MKFLIITKIPPRQGLLGVIAEKITLEEVEMDNFEKLKDSLHIPLDAECLITSMDQVTIIKSRTVNEVI